MNRRAWLINLVNEVTGDKVKAEAILLVLEAEGALHLGFGEAEVDQILAKFKAVFGTTKTTKYDRFAGSRLAQKYGAQAVGGIIDLLGKLSHEKYAPVPRSVADLEDKWTSVLAFLRKQGAGSETIEV